MADTAAIVRYLLRLAQGAIELDRVGGPDSLRARDHAALLMAVVEAIDRGAHLAERAAAEEPDNG